MRRILGLIAVLALMVAFAMPVATADAMNHGKTKDAAEKTMDKADEAGKKAMDKAGEMGEKAMKAEENPCNPCAAKAKNACNPCNPCAAKKKH